MREGEIGVAEDVKAVAGSEVVGIDRSETVGVCELGCFPFGERSGQRVGAGGKSFEEGGGAV
jgi:hypothetical protein